MLSVNVITPSLGANVGGQSKDYSVDNDDIQVRSTWRGTGIGHDEENDNLLVVMYPDEKVKGDVYITPTSASVVKQGSGCSEVTNINKIPVSANKLDSEISDYTNENIIAVGGPCVNSVTRALMGNPADCSSGFMAGKAMLKLVENGDNIALVVAGGTAKDTLELSRVLSNYDENADKLKGMESEFVFDANPTALVNTASVVADPVVPEIVTKVEDVVVETPKETFECAGSTKETGHYEYQIKKLVVTKDVESAPVVEMDGLNGKLIFDGEKSFEAQMGVDWLAVKVHVMKNGDCSGEEVATLDAKWEDGDRYKEIPFTVPEEGCYCMKVGDGDVTIDDASITMTSEPMGTAFRTG